MYLKIKLYTYGVTTYVSKKKTLHIQCHNLLIYFLVAFSLYFIAGPFCPYSLLYVLVSMHVHRNYQKS